MKRILMTLMFLVGLLATAQPTAALTMTPPPPIEPPLIMPPIWQMEGLRIASQSVDVQIENQIATTRIDQLFVNDGDGMLEGVYLFPLPVGATVTELTMWIDGVPIESKILPRDEAREIYDTIVRQLRDPALLEYVGTEAIQANVFPIPAKEQRRIEIEYQQVVTADNGLIHYTYPQSSKLYTNLPLERQNIRVEIRSDQALRTVYSPSHPIAENRLSDFHTVLGYEDTNVLATADYELYYGVAAESIGLNLLTYKEEGQDGFFLLLAAPSVVVDESQIVARDVILVMDTSGSMAGEKMAQAQAAAVSLVEQLRPFDRVNIVSFSTGVRTFLPALTPVGDAADYPQFVNSLEALGGTNISQALLVALEQVDESRPTTILFLTDGLPTEGIVEVEALLAAVDQSTPANVRLFAFGVGDDVDTFLLDSLTSTHRGTTSYVRPSERIDEKVDSLFTKMSTPVLADISLDFGGNIVEELYPNTLPDLFAGSQLVLVGRYRQTGPATITLRGDVNGEEQVFVYENNIFRVSGGDEFIPRLWATRAIGNLLQQIRLQGESEELVASVVNLSIRYGIITPYTSYLIEEDDIFSQLGRQNLVDDVMEEAEMAPPMEASGGEAVDRAEFSGGMAEASAPMALPTAAATMTADGTSPNPAVANQPVRLVGSKTFVWRDGRWLDTAYDPSQPVQEVGFASDTYFDLLSAVPEIGPYFALGEQVVVVMGDVTYAVVPGAGQESVTLPQELIATTTPLPAGATPVVVEAVVTPALATPTPSSPVPSPQSPTASLPWGWLIGGVAAAVLFIALLWRRK